MSCKTRPRFYKTLLLATIVGIAGCAGDDGKDVDSTLVDSLQSQITDLGDQLTVVNDELTVSAAAKGEQCATCHTGDNPIAKSGAGHQADYDEFYQDGVIVVTNLAYSNDGTNDIVTFTLKKDGAAFDCTEADSLAINFAEYDSGNRTFSDGETSGFWKGINGTLVDDGAGNCTSTKAQTALGDLDQLDGHIALYGRDETLYSNSAKHFYGPKYPFAAMVKTGTTGTDYASNANSSGCENCHTQPFLKHGNIYGEVNSDGTNTGNDFYVCKTCHLDARGGGHEDWQILKDDPARYAEMHDADNPVAITTEEKTKYAYKTKLMNDVHMSHNMEFGYPQSMKTCNTCHEGKLDTTITDAFFTAETCISCHSVDGIKAKMTADDTKAAMHANITDTDANLRAAVCSTCHKNTNSAGAPGFSTIHTGYDPEIYDATGARYADTVKVTVDDTTSYDSATNTLTVKFSSTGSVTNADLTPELVIGLYGYDTKHYLIPPHGRDADRNRLLEYTVGDTHPRFTTVSGEAMYAGAAGSWEVTVDLSMWADQLADGSIKRAEIGVMPVLYIQDGEVDDRTRPENNDSDRSNNISIETGEVAMNAPSRTFDLTTNAFDDNYFADVIDVEGCNSCHDALATTFHSGKRGGNIKICKMCHVPSSAGSHLELQSRGIDSYVHAVHSFQGFDIGDVDFSDAVETMEYNHKINSQFPRFGIKNCESCHNTGMYDVPDQSKSLPSLLASTDTVDSGRKVGAIPRYVTGPASTACGSCHRSQMLNADDADGLATLNAHTSNFGYMVENDTGVWDAVVAKVMALF